MAGARWPDNNRRRVCVQYSASKSACDSARISRVARFVAPLGRPLPAFGGLRLLVSKLVPLRDPFEPHHERGVAQAVDVVAEDFGELFGHGEAQRGLPFRI